ncbi:hypothetical protein BYT27DRAFT_7175738 [Phlegmacium glaucopus]|nr:hypothetical protein BYT27DRAFT_7175738 [Phlegmacium glaucopus]
MNAIRSDSMTALRTYSDVVASRPPSPVKEISVLPSGSPVEGAIRASEPDRLINETLITEINNDVEIERFTSSDSGDIATRKNELPWTTVRRRRARSLSSLEKSRNLTHEQSQAVKIAAEALTAKQKQRIQRRRENL